MVIESGALGFSEKEPAQSHVIRKIPSRKGTGRLMVLPVTVDAVFCIGVSLLCVLYLRSYQNHFRKRQRLRATNYGLHFLNQRQSGFFYALEFCGKQMYI